MKKILLYLSIFILLISCTPNPTEKQNEFANLVLEKPHIQHVEWQTTLSLWVQVDKAVLGTNPKVQAQYLAEDIAAAGMKYTQKDICVNIYYDSSKAIASACQKY